MKFRFLILFFFVSSVQFVLAQKNGVAGYGRIESNIVFAKLNVDTYLGAGGGVIINNNIIFGAYLKALVKPYSYNPISPSRSSVNSGSNPFSNNPNAFSTTINNLELGGALGFNIAPEKPFQATFRALLGYSGVSFNESSIYEDVTASNGYYIVTKSPFLSGLNASVEGEGQFKIGRSFKVGLLLGYHLSYINGTFRGNKAVLKSPFMFSGGYIGTSLSFGSFH